MKSGVITFDISALILLIIGGIYYGKSSNKGAVRDGIFSLIISVCILAGIFDIFRVIINGNYELTGLLGYKFNILFYDLCIFVMPLLYLLYMVEITDTWHRLRKYVFGLILSTIPLFIGVSLIVAGMFSSVLFSVDVDGNLQYKRGFVVFILCALFYVCVDMYYAHKMIKYKGKIYSIQLIVPSVTMLIGTMVQLMDKNLRVIVLVIALDCLMLILISRRTEEALDPTTGFRTYWAFSKEMKLKMSTEKNIRLILINIVNFEHALRVAGYDDGQEMMKNVAQSIMNIMSEYNGNYEAYYNGDGKFAIELSKKHFNHIEAIAQKFESTIVNDLCIEIPDVDIMVNVCIAKCPEDINDVESLFMLVTDLDIFDTHGRILMAPEITGTKEFTIKKEMSTIIDKALANNYFTVFYQPIYNVKEKRFASAEALIRLRDPKYGYISPGMFIPLAEKSGAIHAIGSFVIDEVCKFAASEEFEKLEIDYIEINLSVMQCLRVDLADEIIEKSQKYGVDPKRINLEITETASAYSQDKLRNNVFTLNKYGFTFSLDDFGTGYSNLMRIKALPLSIVKLDRAFVLLEEKNNQFHNIISNLIRMLKDMGMDVLVEGIETEEMVKRFIELGVDEIQGFYFSRPLPKSDYLRFLREHDIGKYDKF